MGMEDRDWYREKEIDWDRGGLRERKQRRFPGPEYLLWILAAILLIVIVVLFWQI